MADSTCSIIGCDRPLAWRGWCRRHYNRWRRYGDPVGQPAPKKRNPRAICAIENCNQPVVGFGWCSKHYQRWRAYGDPLGTAPPRIQAPLEERFWSRVDTSSTDGCWEWQGPLARTPRNGKKEYGRFWHSSTDWESAHRLAWRLTYGDIPEGLDIRHVVCDNPPCCRPDHLAPGTHRDNMQDMMLKGRHRTSLGQDRPAARFTNQEVLDIRQLHANGIQTTAEIAEEFGVDFSTIWKIVTRHSWKHLD